MSKIKIFFIRHGEVENPKGAIYGRTDIPLSESGIKQISKLAQKLSACDIIPDIIYTSPLSRTAKTAQVLAQAFSPTPTIVKDERLLETDTQGMDEMSISELHKWGDYYQTAKEHGYEIESVESILERMLAVVDEVQDKHRQETVFIIGHGDPLVLTFGALLYGQEKTPPINELHEYYPRKGEVVRYNKSRKPALEFIFR